MRQTAHGSLVLLVGQVASTVILALAIIFIARLLGPGKLGEYTIVMVPIGIATLLQDLGINAGLTKYLAQYYHQNLEQEKRSILATGFTFNILVSTFIAAGVFLFSPQISSSFLQRSDLTPLLQVASLAIVGQALINTTNAVFIGFMRMELQSLNTLIFAISKSIASPLLVYLGLSTMGAVIGHSATIFVTGSLSLLIALLFLRDPSGGIKTRPTLTELGHLLRYGAPLYLSSLLGGGLTQIYSSLMVICVTTELIGNYSAAINFTVLVAFLTVPIATALFPLFSKLQRDSPELKNAYQSATKYSALITLPAATALIALSWPMMKIIYGASYSEAPSYLQLYLLTYLPIGVGSLCFGPLLNGQGETHLTLRLNALTLIVGAPLSLVLIPRWGINGLIATLVASPIPATAYSIILIKRYFDIAPDWVSSAKIYASSITALAATLLFTAYIYLTPWPKLIAGAAIYVAVYAASIKLTRTLNEEDYRMFKAIIGDTGPLVKPLRRIIEIIEKI